MPRLPDLTALGERPAPRPSQGVATYRPTTGMEDFQADVLSRGGAQMESAAGELQTAYRREKERVDTARAEEAFTELQKKKLDLQFGDKGFMSLRGGDAIKTPVLKTYMGELNGSTEALSSGLANDNQRRLFKNRAGVTSSQMYGEIQSHILRESEAYQKDVAVDGIKNEILGAAAQPTNEIAFRESLARMDGLIDKYAKDNGQDPEHVKAWKSDVMNQALVARFQSWMYADPVAAKGAFAVYADKFSPAVRLQMEEHLKRTAQPIEARTLAEKAIGPDGLSIIEKSVTTGVNGGSSVDTKALLGSWILKGEEYARTTHPNDPVFADLVTSQIKNKVSTIVAAQEGIQRQAHSYLLTTAAGVTNNGPGPKPTSLDQLLSTPQARAAWNNLDENSMRGVVAYLGHNAQEAEGRPAKVNAKLVQDLFTRMYLPSDDPKSITRPEQLTPFIAQGLNPEGHARLQKELVDLKNPEGRDFRQDVQHARSVARLMMTRSILGGVQPEVAEEAAYRWSNALSEKVEAYRKQGKEPRDLITPGKPEYMLSPETVSSFMPKPSSVITAEAGRIKNSEYKVGEIYTFKQGKFKYKGGDPLLTTSFEVVN